MGIFIWLGWIAQLEEAASCTFGEEDGSYTITVTMLMIMLTWIWDQNTRKIHTQQTRTLYEKI